MKSKSLDMTEGNLFKKIFLYSLPIVFSGILQLLYYAFDLIVCGTYGSTNSTAAISSTNSLINLIVNLFLGLSVGANVLMARCYGQKNKEKADKVAYTSMAFSLIVGIVIGAFGILTSGFFLKLMGTPEDVIELSTAYLRIYFLGLPFSMIYNFGAAILRATGDSRKPFYYLTLSGVANVLLNLLFVIVFKLDVPGVAIATVISQGISALLIVLALLFHNNFFEFKIKKLRLYKEEALEIIKIGLPAGLQGVIFSFSNVLIQSSVNSLGTAVVGGNGASSSLEGFIYTSMNGVAQACAAFVSANYGAGKKKNIKKTVLSGAILVLLMNLVTGGLILLFRKELLGLYVTDQASVDAGLSRLLIISLTYFLCGYMDLFANSLRGMGYSVTPMIISLLGACGLRIFWIYTFFPMKELHNISGLAVSYPISWIITAFFQILLFLILYNKLRFKNDIMKIEE